MEKFLQSYNITQSEFISYFSCEFFLIAGVLINLIMFLFFSRKYNIKRLSDLTTFSIFSINSLICLGIYIKNKITFGNFNLSLFNENLILNNETFLLNFLLYAFLACFILCSYRLTRRANFMGTIINISLLLLGLSCTFLTRSQNGILAFFFLDLASFFIYKFASNMRIRKYEAYSIDFIMMSATSTLLFYSFYLFSFLTKEELQLIILQTCMACALLLKAGLFPIYNYILNRHTKTNLAYSVLLFGFLPYLGTLAFIKFIQNINLSNEIFFITMSIFICILMLISAINLFKSKNLIKIFANVAYFNCSFYLISVLFMQETTACIYSIFASLFGLFAIFSLTAILKINLKQGKLNALLLKNLFIKNRLFCVLFSISILIFSNVIPSVLLKNNFNLLSGIYVFDKIGFWFALIYLFSNMLLILKSLKLIKICYSKNNTLKNSSILTLTKRTTPNYVVPIVILLLLVLLIFL